MYGCIRIFVGVFLVAFDEEGVWIAHDEYGAAILIADLAVSANAVDVVHRHLAESVLHLVGIDTEGSVVVVFLCDGEGGLTVIHMTQQGVVVIEFLRAVLSDQRVGQFHVGVAQVYRQGLTNAQSALDHLHRLHLIEQRRQHGRELARGRVGLYEYLAAVVGAGTAMSRALYALGGG